MRTRKEKKAIGYEEKLEKGGGGEWQGNAGRRYRKEKKGNLDERNGGRNFTGKKGLSRVSEAIERVGRKIRGQVEGRGTTAEKV